MVLGERGKPLESVLLGLSKRVLHMPPLALDGAICGQFLPQLTQVRPFACAEMTSLAGLGAEASLRAAELVQRDRDSPCCCQAPAGQGGTGSLG